VNACALFFRSRSFGYRGCPLYRCHVEVKESFVLVALLLVLLAQADYFSKNLDVEAIAFGFRIDFLFGLGQILDLVFDLLNALDNRPQLVARYVNWSAHGLLLVNMTVQKSDIDARASRRAAQRGKQPINGGVSHQQLQAPDRFAASAPVKRDFCASHKSVDQPLESTLG
jgi:hypothetical protein